MSKPPALVVGDDGSASASTALAWVASQPWPGWTCDVVTADSDPAAVTWGTPPALEPWDPPAPPNFGDHGPEVVRFVRATADPRVLLAGVSPDLLVIGVHHDRALAGMWSGSTAEWLLQHPPCPLVLARATAPVLRVVVGTDGSPHAVAAARVLAALPLVGDAAVTVLAVDDGRIEVAHAIAEVASALDGVARSVSTRVASGHPTQELIDAAAGADLVVLGTRGLTGWRRLRLGSTAAAVARATAVSALLATGPRGQSDPAG